MKNNKKIVKITKITKNSRKNLKNKKYSELIINIQLFIQYLWKIA